MANRKQVRAVGKRKRGISSLREDLELIESQKQIKRMQEAGKLWALVSDFKPAKVLLASEKVSPKFFKEDPSSGVESMIEEHIPLFREVEEHREFRCCRGLALGKHMGATDIVAVAKPLMSVRKSKKLSTYSDLIELMLKFTHVDVDGSKEEFVEEWDEVEEWINTTVESFSIFKRFLILFS